MPGEKSKTACWRNADSLLRSERRYRCGTASGKTAACTIPSFPCMKSWDNAINGNLPKWSAGGYSDSWRHRPRSPHVRLCEPLCDLLRGGAAALSQRRISGRFGQIFGGFSGSAEDRNRAPAEAQRSGFGGKRRRSGMSKFSPLSAETRDMELVPTRSRIKGWRRNRRSVRSLLPAVRAVDGGFSAGGCGAF